MPAFAEDDIRQLTIELRKLRQAIERSQQALFTAKDAGTYLDFCEPKFRELVRKGVIPQTRLDPDMNVRYSRAALDRVIAEHTEVS